MGNNGRAPGDVGDTFNHRAVDHKVGGDHETGRNALRTTGGNRCGDNARDWAVRPPVNKGATSVQEGALWGGRGVFGRLSGNSGIAGGAGAGADPNYPDVGLTEVVAMAIRLAGGFGGLGRDAGGIAAFLARPARATGRGGNFGSSIERPGSTRGRPEGRKRK